MTFVAFCAARQRPTKPAFASRAKERGGRRSRRGCGRWSTARQTARDRAAQRRSAPVLGRVTRARPPPPPSASPAVPPSGAFRGTRISTDFSKLIRTGKSSKASLPHAQEPGLAAAAAAGHGPGARSSSSASATLIGEWRPRHHVTCPLR